MFEKLMASFRPKQVEEPKEEPKVEEQQEPTPVVLDPELVGEWETKLVDFVYDTELAKDLAPVFVKLSSAEGFDKVLELLATKEKQIEAIGAGSNQQSSPEQTQEEKDVRSSAQTYTATDILKERYSQNLK